MSKKIVEIKNLKQYFNEGTPQEVKAVDDLTFDIYRGETLGLVGESGSGKTTTGFALAQLNQPTSGEIIFDGKNVSQIGSRADELAFRKEVQVIFQDPYASLNPRMKVRDIIGEGLRVHGLATTNQQVTKEVERLLDLVGLNRDHADRYPHEFSGGQRQRIGIARALAVDPQLIIADEPISALDVSIQAQVVNLLVDLQQEFDLTMLFIAHDISMVRYISDRIAVMYHGRIVELAEADELYEKPLHPYTLSLLSAIPVPDPIVEKQRERIYFTPKEIDHSLYALREISDCHFVYCKEDEVQEYRQKLSK